MHVRSSTYKEVIDVIKHRLIRRFADEGGDAGAAADAGASVDTGAADAGQGDGTAELSPVQQLVTQDVSTEVGPTMPQPAMHRDPSPAENAKSQDDMLTGVSENGRTLLQAMAKWKYQISQCVRIAGQDDRLAKKIEQNLELIDNAMATVYSVCFAMENLQVAPVYTEEQLMTGDNSDAGYDLDEEIPAADEEEPAEAPAEEAADEDDEEKGGADVEFDEELKNLDEESEPEEKEPEEKE